MVTLDLVITFDTNFVKEACLVELDVGGSNSEVEGPSNAYATVSTVF